MRCSELFPNFLTFCKGIFVISINTALYWIWKKICHGRISEIINYLMHTVGRVLSFFSSRRNRDSPTPLAAGECAPPPFGPGGGHTRLRERGWGSPNSDEGIYNVVLYIYKYFVTLMLLSTHRKWSRQCKSNQSYCFSVQSRAFVSAI